MPRASTSRRGLRAPETGGRKPLAELDLAHRQLEGLRVTALDRLGLVLAHAGAPSRIGPALPERDAVDRSTQRGALPGERLQETKGAARRHDRDLVLDGELLAH